MPLGFLLIILVNTSYFSVGRMAFISRMSSDLTQDASPNRSYLWVLPVRQWEGALSGVGLGGQGTSGWAEHRGGCGGDSSLCQAELGQGPGSGARGPSPSQGVTGGEGGVKEQGDLEGGVWEGVREEEPL